MRKQGAGRTKRHIAVAAVLIGGILALLTFMFVQGVKTELWEQSITTILESTRQGCNTLKIQLKDDYESMDAITKVLKDYSVQDKDALNDIINGYTLVQQGTSLLLPDGSSRPEGTRTDEETKALLAGDKANGIIDPHISSVTGANVFQLFVRVTLKDGTNGYLLKEYEVENIVDSFSLSFYNDTGFSYVVNMAGDVLIRPPHPNSNKTVQNLFDMLPETQNNPASLNQFSESLKNAKTGWAVFTYQGEETVFCYTPLKLQTDWYLISIIPNEVVGEQTNQILTRSMALIGSILLGIALLVFFYLNYAHRTNRKLKNQAEYIGHLYNAVPEGIALITVDLPYRFIQLNQEGLRLLGFPADYTNDTIRDTGLSDVVHPDDYGRLEQLFMETAANGETQSFEIRILKPGGFFWGGGIVEKTMDDNGYPVLITTIHDITIEKLAREAADREKLQERITLVGAISNAYPVIISMNLTQDTLSFIYVKPGLMMNLGEQKSYRELFEYTLSTVYPDNVEEYWERFSMQNLQRILGKDKNEVFLEVRQRLADGQYHWTSTQIIYVDNPYSEDKLAVLISRRIDEQRHEEEQRRQALQSALDSATAASNAKSQFLSNMSHDIRTPMNAIVGMTAIATAHLDDSERVMECLKKINLSSQHLLSLINDILDMSKIESGKLSLRDEPFNFAQLTAECVELVRSQAEAKQLDLDVQLMRLKNEKVIGDPLRIRQVYINILSNAVKYTPDGGRIRLEIRQEAASRREYQSYVFCCADTGVGMSRSFLNKLFQPFERVQDSTSSKITGTGLGMAITKNLIDLMNGDIQVESKPGEGSVFTVTVPLRLQDVPPEDVPPEWIGIHSLIVDDDRQTCETAAELLQDMGIRAQFVTRGAEAVQVVLQAQNTSDPFQLVIVDWKMPDMDGVEVARRIRKKIGPDIPVIILTAYDWSDIEYEARQAGVTAFLAKPFYRTKICYLLNELSGEKQTVPINRSTPMPGYSGRRILLAEDNEINREIARTLLEETGAQVEEACDGQEAVKLVSASSEGYYDLIFMDIQMPRMNGYEAAKAIRHLNRKDVQTMPIVAMTANAFEEDVRAALNAGMDAHFAKPIDVNELYRLLSRYLTAEK